MDTLTLWNQLRWQQLNAFEDQGQRIGSPRQTTDADRNAMLLSVMLGHAQLYRQRRQAEQTLGCHQDSVKSD